MKFFIEPQLTGLARATVIATLVATLVGACGQQQASPNATPSASSIQHGSLTSDGLKRTYRLYIPPLLDRKHAAPLVVLLTCGPCTGDQMAQITNFDDQATIGGFIAVYPDPVPDAALAPRGAWNAGPCCGDAQANGVDDVGFIRRLLDRLITDYRIDTTKIFVAGLSAGAFMVYRLACELSDRITAIASVSGVMITENCRPARPVSVLEMHGTKDALVPYAGGAWDNANPATVSSTASVIQQWVTLNGCTATPTQTVSGITNSSLWSGCREGTAVRLDTVTGGHHTWFGSVLDPVPGEPSSNAVVWNFFSNLPPRA
jgi:polyhydroxybutyrate depolymerase